MNTAEESVRREKVALLYRQLPPLLAVNVAISALVVVALWSPARSATLVAWLAVQAAVLFARGLLCLGYRRHWPPTRDVHAWELGFAAGAAASGLLWGLLAPLFLEVTDVTSVVVVTFVTGGMTAGALATLSIHLPSFLGFLVMAVGPLILLLLTSGEAPLPMMGGMTAVYAIGLAGMGTRFSQALGEMLRLTVEHRRLLAEMEVQVRERTAQLEAANLAKTRFLAAASHDLRQPLQSVLLFSAMLDPYVADAKGQQVLGLLHSGLETMSNLFNSLLDLSRMDTDVAKPDIRPMPLRPLLEEIAAGYRPRAATKGLAFVLDLHNDCLVLSDANLLGRMLRNLIENAVRYTDIGEIRLEAGCADGHARIAVHDTGRGITPDQLAWIFEEFHRGDGARHGDRGLGLGLAIVRRLSVILCHPIEVTSQPGKGSCFAIQLPLA